MTTAEIIDRLKQATQDLVWVSESDYPFEVVTWKCGTQIDPKVLFTSPTVADLINVPIESITLKDFFAPAITIEDWYEQAELTQVDRYQKLLQAIESNLTEVTVFRVGEIEIAIYIIGKTPNGDLVGLKTQIVET